MANKDAPFGFRPINMDGSPYNGATIQCYVTTTPTAALFIGDPVKLATSGANSTGVADVVQGTAGAATYGVITSFVADPSDLSAQHRKVATARTINICPVEGKYFEVQSDDTGTALALASIGLNTNYTAAAGSAYTGASGFELDAATVATTTGFDLQIVGFTNDPDNLHSGTGSAPKRVIVRFNNSQLRSGRTGVS